MQMVRIFVGAFLAVAVCSLVPQTAFAQDVDVFAQQLLHEFTNKDGEVVAEGTLIKIDGNKIVVNQNREEIRLLISDLSDETQAWVKEEAAAQKVREQTRKKFQKFVEDNLNNNSDAKIISGLTGIRKLGKDAPYAPQVLQRFLGPPNSEKVRYQAFLAYIATSNDTEMIFAKTLEQVIEDRFEIMERVSRAPKDYMEAIATFDATAIPYLKSAAYTGDLIPEDTDPIAPADPVGALSKEKARVRIAAIHGLSKLPADETVYTVISVLEAAEDVEDDEPDASVIKACLTAIGDMGMMTDMVEEKLDEYEDNEEFGSLVERAREKISKANTEENGD